MKNHAYPLYDVSPVRDLKEMVRRKAESAPLNVAFSYSEGKDKIINKTFSEFSSEIDALGTYLFEMGLFGKHIAIISENSYEWLLAFFSIVNGGNVVVPIDKELLDDDIEKLLIQSDCSAVIYSRKCSDKVRSLSNVTKISITEFPDYISCGRNLINEGNDGFTDYEVVPEKLAIIAFTSGTTGRSKGVILSHKNIVSDINNGSRNFLIDGNSFAVLPFHHMFGLVVGILIVFNYGQSSFICSSLKKLLLEMKLSKPKITFLVPLFVETFYKQIFNTAAQNKRTVSLKIAMRVSNILLKLGIDLRPQLFKSIQDAFGGKLQYIISGGAAINPQYMTSFRTWGIEIRNAYGITECSPGIAVNRNYHYKDDSAGPPIQNCNVKIDTDGEILVKGDNVMLGYYNDSKSTSAAFVDGWYATGDIGYIDSDGFLFLTGRKKNLIILSNGENVSPEEIENQLLLHNEVQEVVVYSDDGILTAEIFPSEEFMGNQDHFNELVNKANQGQPSYKQINKIKLREVEFEKNSTKKILRHKVMEVNDDRQN